MFPPSADTVRAARRRGGLTQAELGRRLGTSQAAVAQLEGPRSNPTVQTLERVLHATGHRLDLVTRPVSSSIDETLVARQLRMTPAERIAAFEASYAGVRGLARAAARARGELA